MAKAKKKEALTLEEKLEQALVPVEEQPYEVPENWCWTKIKYGFDVTSSKRIHKSDWISEGIPFYRTRELVKLSNDGYVNNELFISKELYESLISNFGKPEKNDILVSGVGTIGVPYIVDGTKDFYFKDGNVIWFKNKKLFTAQYVYYLYKSLFMKNQIYRKSAGTTVDTYTIVNANETILPLPPLAEQQRIVEQIESLFAKLDAVKEIAQEVLDSYEIRRVSILHKALNGELTVSWREKNKVDELWEEHQLGDITDIKSSKRVYKEDYVEKGIPFYRSSEVVDLYDTGITEPIYFITEEKYDEIRREKGVPEEGNLLVTSVGTIGKTWIVDDRKFYYKDGNLTEVVKCDRLDMKFLQMFIMSEEFKHQVIDTVSGSAYNALTIVKFKKIMIKLPSVDEQKEIVRLAGQLLKKEQQVKESVEEVLVNVDMMKKSILAKAFRGELGTNNPNEESAIELLKSILE